MESKYLCVMALFDEDTNLKIQKIRDILEENNLSFNLYPPHITIGAYVDINKDILTNYISDFISKTKFITINLNTIGNFSNKVIFLTSDDTNNIKNLHFNFHQKYDEYHGNVGYNYSLKSNKFTPHMTLLQSNNENDIEKALKLLKELNININAKISKIGLYEFHPIREIKIFNLKKDN